MVLQNYYKINKHSLISKDFDIWTNVQLRSPYGEDHLITSHAAILITLAFVSHYFSLSYGTKYK